MIYCQTKLASIFPFQGWTTIFWKKMTWQNISPQSSGMSCNSPASYNQLQSYHPPFWADKMSNRPSHYVQVLQCSLTIIIFVFAAKSMSMINDTKTIIK